MRVNARNTRRVTALTLAAALVVAVYLNWQYARTGAELETEAVNVSARVAEEASAPITDGLMTEAEAVSSTNKNSGQRIQRFRLQVFRGSPAQTGKGARRRSGHHPKDPEICVALGRREEVLCTGIDRKPREPQRRNGDRNTGQSQGLCRLPLLFAGRPGRPDGDDLRRRAHRCAGGADPGYHPE